MSGSNILHWTITTVRMEVSYFELFNIKVETFGNKGVLRSIWIYGDQRLSQTLNWYNRLKQFGQPVQDLFLFHVNVKTISIFLLEFEFTKVLFMPKPGSVE